MKSVSEQDWNVYKDLVPVVRERYTARQNNRLQQLLSDDTKSQTDRFWESQDFFRKESKILRICLDQHSRSSVVENLANMIALKMIDESDLTHFTSDITSRVSALSKIYSDHSNSTNVA